MGAHGDAVEWLTSRLSGLTKSFRGALVLYFIYKMLLSALFIWSQWFEYRQLRLDGLLVANVYSGFLFEIPCLYILYRGKYRQPLMLLAMSKKNRRILRLTCWFLVIVWLAALLPFVLDRQLPDFGETRIVIFLLPILMFAPLWLIAATFAYMVHRSKILERVKPGHFRIPVDHEEPH